MSPQVSLRELLAPMSDREVDLHGEGFRVDRERLLACMARVKPRERHGWLGYAVLAAAGVALVLAGPRVWSRGSSAPLELMVSEGSATQSDGETRAKVATNAQIAASGELETAAVSHASLRTADGLRIELESQTRVALGELRSSSSELRLLGGVVRCSVPRRSAAHAFRVVTPDVTVVDLGTVFTVSIEGPNRATRVSVEEGEVMVRHGGVETRVQAPASWSSAPSSPSDGPELTAAASGSPTLSNAAPLPSARPRLGTTLPEATLEQEAQLLRLGLAAERQGRAADASDALTQLLQKYPRSPLAPDARAALSRVEASPRR